ncbi:MAG: hypothetical protein ACLFPL_02905 [Candidatus Nanoarchaeia archaeon]
MEYFKFKSKHYVVCNQLQQSRQAISATVFSWVFMTIIGGILILFTYSILQSYWAVETEKNNLEFSKALTNSLEVYAFNPSPQSATVFNTYPIFANKELEFTCVENEFTRLQFENSQLSYGPLNNILDQYPIMMSRLDNELPESVYLIQEDFSFPMSITPLIGVVPTGHIIVINESSQTHDILSSLLNTKRSYRQLSFIIWEDDLSEEDKISQINSRNPTSISFLGFDNTSATSIIDNYYSSVRFDVFALKYNFQRAPSYYDPLNENRIVLGNLSYIYSNNKRDFEYTNQDNLETPHTFNFAHLNDEISLVTFSMFTPPSIFSCAYLSLQLQTDFAYTLRKNKVQTIINSPNNINTTYCSSFRDSSILKDSYENINMSLHILYENSTHNFFNTLTATQINTNINIIEEAQRDLTNDRCELIY